MTKKNKVKELVGGGLNAYHTKALQQMDRIEKKNKEQNHKISMLMNELDNDYLTKTEEGSVISLDHSKEGMVYIDSLEGNTLVNYCTDGSKEMTLNGDIDASGTFVTTTEGVENGLVDVVCEGNTLVNLYKNSTKILSSTVIFSNGEQINYSLFKPNTTYTFIASDTTNKTMYYSLCDISGDNKFFDSYSKISSFVTPADLQINIDRKIFAYSNSENVYTNDDITKIKYIILEGDYTNKPIPQYFEGMKSVGQDDVGGHKVELVSRNKNYFNISKVINNSQVEVIGNKIKLNAYACALGFSCGDLGLIPGRTYKTSNVMEVISGNIVEGVTGQLRFMDRKNQNKWIMSSTFVAPIDISDYSVYLYGTNGTGETVCNFTNIQIEEVPNTQSTNTTYAQHAQNSISIPLSEPLRGLPNGTKDRFVKKDGKWYVERNCGEYIFTGLEPWSISDSSDVSKRFVLNGEFVPNLKLHSDNNTIAPIICNKYAVYPVIPTLTSTDTTGIGLTNIGFSIREAYTSLDAFKSYLTQSSIKVVYQLATPTYEPIENVELITYLETTHISNNSLIPCNMVVKNTGYNAIIKPSTLYTIALDTNKSGTIGMNLSGVKGITTNNVLKLTTPATLTDDSLRLYGKDIKGSKVRLLEGDKTNWIPSHFEGMKSSFEDKVQDDGSYKMEILSNNKNLISFSDLKNVAPANGNTKTIYDNGTITIKNEKETTWSHGFIRLKVEPNTTYTIKTKCNIVCGSSTVSIREDNDSMVQNVSSQLINGEYITTFNSGKNTIIRYKIYSATDISQIGEVKYYDFIMNKVDLDYVENKHNKIQFSSIEPLRGVGDVKDRFVFKDNKLMIERNIIQKFYDGSVNTFTKGGVSSEELLAIDINDLRNKTTQNYSQKDIICDKLCSTGTSAKEGIYKYYSEPSKLSLPVIMIKRSKLATENVEGFIKWLKENPLQIACALEEPTYEEIPFELQKIILEGYENGTLFFDTNIPPTSTTTYAGETPIVSAIKTNKSNVISNTQDINDNIIPYLMDMDYRVVCLQLATEEFEGGVTMARLFGGVYEMLKRDILSKRLSRQEYGYRLADYFNAGKLTEEQVRELEDLR